MSFTQGPGDELTEVYKDQIQNNLPEKFQMDVLEMCSSAIVIETSCITTHLVWK